MRLSVMFFACFALLGCELALPKTAGSPVPEVNAITGAPLAVTSLASSGTKPNEGATTGAQSAPLLLDPKAGLVDAADPEMQAKIAEAKAKAKAEKPAEVKAAEPEPAPPPQTAEELACAATGGVLSAAGDSGAKACVKRTRDSGKSCTRESQCEGYCLARSGTCSPITPMFGCNDILQDDGRQVTLCIE